jgi:hypothetical protein
MKTTKIQIGAGLALAAALGLAGCNRGDGTRLALVGRTYCTPFRSATTTANASNPNGQSGLATNAAAALPTGDPGAALDDCVHRWAYTLAPSRDPADIVAHASIDACSAMVAAVSQPAGPPPDSRDAAAQQAQNPVAQQMRATEGKALFYVVQARAAGCAPPPANSLPAG